MAIIASATACLRIWGDDLHPDAITKQLGKEPTSTKIKGAPWRVLPSGKPGPPAQHGAWHIDTRYEERSADLDSLITRLFEGTTTDLAIWKEITSTWNTDVYCGVWLSEWDQGFGLSADCLKFLADRNIPLEMEIYFEGKEA